MTEFLEANPFIMVVAIIAIIVLMQIIVSYLEKHRRY